ncbi:HIT-like protein [Massarina eburnea CBS 473.64]|uniref:Aprataxin-like protein n=1 Tax=Massarina eburnea CBS 473.64 TaxID=1395130 RepID=A0A6A6SI12_9PLEO|nr:HIT-like protein [Massarina eburnea CBS 473.64]
MSTSKKPKCTPPVPEKKKSFDARSGLGIYLSHPERNPEGRVIEYDDEFVVINDKYPKASVHLLLLPRDPQFQNQHPLNLLSTNPAFLQKVRERCARLKALAASELRRQYGRHSAKDAPYQLALSDLMSASPPPSPSASATLPPGRDWTAEILIGVHTHPSMTHLHIHILSREMASPCVRHKKHYLSFHSPFFVRLDEFPLDMDDKARFHPGNWPNWDMLCWRCERNFGQKFAALNRHLGEEFEGWKRE